MLAASEYGDEEVVEMLIKNGAHINGKNEVSILNMLSKLTRLF